MINIAGASDGRIAQIITEEYNKKKGQYLIVVPTLNRAKRLKTDLSFFSDQKWDQEHKDNGADDEDFNSEGMPIYIMPADDESLTAYEAKSNEDLLKRMRTLKAATSGEPCVIIAPVTGAIRKLPPAEIFTENILRFDLGQDIDLDLIRNKLSQLGYERTSQIESRGEYS
ncbi:MAG: hypothetical protein Q4B78_04740, partial [Bacillota bacterium]|nr:hypothetical protein [Bacillota bacterium]